jgi:hypothetical protein
MGEVCAEVTAVTEDTVTIGDVTFIFAGAADAGIEVGDDVCVASGSGRSSYLEPQSGPSPDLRTGHAHRDTAGHG